MINQPNVKMVEAIHIHYNAQLNELVSAQWRADLEIYEVHRYCELGRISLALMSMDRIIEASKGEQWEFIGVL
jgi:hypothetical protein